MRFFIFILFFLKFCSCRGVIRMRHGMRSSLFRHVKKKDTDCLLSNVSVWTRSNENRSAFILLRLQTFVLYCISGSSLCTFNVHS